MSQSDDPFFEKHKKEFLAQIDGERKRESNQVLAQVIGVMKREEPEFDRVKMLSLLFSFSKREFDHHEKAAAKLTGADRIHGEAILREEKSELAQLRFELSEAEFEEKVAPKIANWNEHQLHVAVGSDDLMAQFKLVHADEQHVRRRFESLASKKRTEESLAVAKEANTISDSANKLSKEGNQIATDGNTIATDGNTIATDANTIANNANRIAIQAKDAAEFQGMVAGISALVVLLGVAIQLYLAAKP
jgi:hypothetical protein